MRMTVSREHTLSEGGVGKPGFPSPRPREGLSGRRPLRTTFVVPLRMRAGGPRTQAPAPLPVKETGRATPSRNPLFVIVSYDRSYAVASIARVRSNVNIRSRRGVWGNRVSPRPRPAGAGETGFPHAPTRGRVWEGAALPGTTVCSSGRDWPSRRGMGKPGFPIPSPGGRAKPSQKQPYAHCGGVRRSRMDGSYGGP